MTQQQYQQTQQSTQPTFDQYLPQAVSQAVYDIEQLETDAEWAHGQAMKQGDVMAADKLADIADVVHVQKNLLLRESELAETVGQCTQQALQQCSQLLQGSQTPGVQQVVQQAQRVAQQITQAAQQPAQAGQAAGEPAGQQFGGQSIQSPQGTQQQF